MDELYVRRPLIPGYQTRLVDGNHLAATEHRLTPLRAVSVGALPGVAVVVYDRERQLVAEVDYSADAYTQERKLVLETLGRATRVQPCDRSLQCPERGSGRDVQGAWSRENGGRGIVISHGNPGSNGTGRD